jgi:hypothetical protein
MVRTLASYGDKVQNIHISNSNDSPARHRPELAIAAMNVIAEYSILDAFFRSLFLQFLGNNPRPAAAIYASINSDAGKQDAFRAVSKSLSPDELDILEALFFLQKKCAKARNRLAHWTWGHASELPEAFLLVDPDSHAQNTITSSEEQTIRKRHMLARMLQREIDDPPIPYVPPRIPLDGILVYDRKDLAEASAKIQRLIGLVVQFRFIVMKSPVIPVDEPPLAQLLAEPEIRTFVDRQIENRKRSQAAQQQQPQTPHQTSGGPP